ncbi:MAG: glycerol-3-phosphate dehydrogenase [Coxiellaceae bacterium]|nr:glycerol-3-phosphate dehydrogenase [Coxiellaceae bacterium]
MSFDNAENYDLVVIGGGINGCSIAADAAGRGLSVLLCEQNDLASGTSSYSSKLIHGGLRYLEQNEFKLVKHALSEREVWLHRAPHLIQPLEFILPYEQHQRPKWILKLGLWFYDHLAKRHSIPASSSFKRNDNELLTSLAGRIQYGFSYYDCFCDDARVVISIAQQAEQHGATIKTHHKCTQAKLNSQRTHWDLTLLNQHSETTHKIRSKAVVNAAGPWVGNVSQQLIQPCHPHRLRLIKGSHIVVPKLYNGDQAYILQNIDKRIVFVIPYQEEYSLIGTTDEVFHGAPDEAHITHEEIDYLTVLINHYFKKSISASDIVWQYSGVRPLLDEEGKLPSEISRDYQVILDQYSDTAPLLTVTGGKLTTARLLARDTLDKLKPFFPKLGDEWTADAFLPGGNLNGLTLGVYIKNKQHNYPDLPPVLIKRYCQQYGNRIDNLLSGVKTTDQLGQHFGGNLYQAEVEYLRHNEWAYSADDILWRRTKLGLALNKQQQHTLQQYLETI